ncbi:hypothetical protein GCM10009549_05310 [Streptomyces thermoalcalitolerans]|uniref:Uncharacterized protein n=1 Tax=Streptomyces thermoalcalitolerans TaxID=65605 RepID=A0ABP3YSW1_9ACTN
MPAGESGHPEQTTPALAVLGREAGQGKPRAGVADFNAQNGPGEPDSRQNPAGTDMPHCIREQFTDHQGCGVYDIVVQSRIPTPYPVHGLVPRGGDRVCRGRYRESKPVRCHG